MSKGYLLVIEDHRDLAATIIQSLESYGYTVDYASDGFLGLELATKNVFDAIILDINLPGKDGFQVSDELRNRHAIDWPVLMLTARDELEDKLMGFESGADDYLVKPFEMAELLARINSLVKRKKGAISPSALSISNLSLDPKTMIVKRGDDLINLSPIGFNILRILMREHPKIVTRPSLEQELWGEEIPESDALKSHLYTLRKQIDGPYQDKLLKTVKGVGVKIEA